MDDFNLALLLLLDQLGADVQLVIHLILWHCEPLVLEGLRRGDAIMLVFLEEPLAERLRLGRNLAPQFVWVIDLGDPIFLDEVGGVLATEAVATGKHDVENAAHAENIGLHVVARVGEELGCRVAW